MVESLFAYLAGPVRGLDPDGMLARAKAQALRDTLAKELARVGVVSFSPPGAWLSDGTITAEERLQRIMDGMVPFFDFLVVDFNGTPSSGTDHEIKVARSLGLLCLVCGRGNGAPYGSGSLSEFVETRFEDYNRVAWFDSVGLLCRTLDMMRIDGCIDSLHWPYRKADPVTVMRPFIAMSVQEWRQTADRIKRRSELWYGLAGRDTSGDEHV